MEKPREQPTTINLKSQLLVVILSSFLGFFALLLDIYLDFLVLGIPDFGEYLQFEIESGQFITRRFWIVLFPIMGLIMHYLIVSREIRIYKEEAKWIDIMRHSKEMFVIYDPKQIIQVNTSFKNILGYSEEEIENLRISDFFKKYILCERHGGGEFSWIAKDGSVHYVDVTLTSVPFRDVNMLIASDITEKQELRKEKEELKRQINREERMTLVGKLAGGIAHDFNNQLSIIIGNAELLKVSNTTDDGEEMLEQIISTGEKAAELTSQLLTISKDKTIDFRKINVTDIFDELIKMTDRVFPKFINITTNRPNQPLIIESDEVHLFNALLNILLNAKDAMPEGGRLVINTSTTSFSKLDIRKLGYQINPGKYVVILIEDTGTGMDDHTLNKIFDPFFTTKQKGTGLGLSRVYSIIRSHNGWITVDSTKGEGTIFYIYLPLAGNGAEIKTKSPEDLSLPKGYTCMIIDDEILIRELLDKYLKYEGCNVVMSGNSTDALSYYQQHFGELDLIFLDVDMEGLNGWQVISQMKLINSEVSNIILLSGSIELTDTKLKKFDTQIAGILRKPFNRNDLLTTITSIDFK